MNDLKTKKLSIILFLTLIVSIITNAYLLWEVRSSARLPGLFNPSCWPSLKAVYPESGISTKDMNDILLVFGSLEIETDDAGILLIKVFDSQHVLITTGHVEGSLVHSRLFTNAERGLDFPIGRNRSVPSSSYNFQC